MIRTFVYDKGLVGGSQPELLKHLLDELGVDDDSRWKPARASEAPPR
jgi:hypothetical protein